MHFEKRLTRRDYRGTRCGRRCFRSSHLGDTPSIMRARSSCHSLRRFSFISFSHHSALCSFCPPFCIFRTIFYRDNLFLLMRHLRMFSFIFESATHHCLKRSISSDNYHVFAEFGDFYSFSFRRKFFIRTYVSLEYSSNIPTMCLTQ